MRHREEWVKMDTKLNDGWICAKHNIGYISKCPSCAFEVENISKGDKITFQSENGETITAKCTGVTHKNLIHYGYKKEDGTPIAGFIGRDNVKKVTA